MLPGVCQLCLKQTGRVGAAPKGVIQEGVGVQGKCFEQADPLESTHHKPRLPEKEQHQHFHSSITIRCIT